MRRILLGVLLFAAGSLGAQGTDPTPATASPSVTPPAAPIKKWSMALVPWDDWFKANKFDVTVEDKTSYVYFFWNAQDFKANFEVKDKKLRLYEAALQLVSRLCPTDAKADLMKVDIVYYLERDNYGQPLPDSLQQVAHFEFLKSKAMKAAKGKKEPSLPNFQKTFNKAIFY